MYFFMTLIQGNVNFLKLLDNVIILILTTYILYGWASKNSITKVMQYQRHIYTYNSTSIILYIHSTNDKTVFTNIFKFILVNKIVVWLSVLTQQQLSCVELCLVPGWREDWSMTNINLKEVSFVCTSNILWTYLNETVR